MFEENRTGRYKVEKEGKNQIWTSAPKKHQFCRESRNICVLLTGEDMEIQAKSETCSRLLSKDWTHSSPQIAFELVTWIITARFEFHYQNDILGFAFRDCRLFENGWAFKKYGTLIKLSYKSIRTEVGDKDVSNPEPQILNHCQKIGEWSMQREVSTMVSRKGLGLS